MATAHPVPILPLLATFLLTATYADDCGPLLTFPSTATPLSNCASLSALSASLQWTLHRPSSTADVAFRAPLPSSGGWAAWGLNLNSQGMVGTQALVAVLFANGSLSFFTTPVNVTHKSGQAPLAPGKLSYAVTGLEAAYADGLLTIYASIGLPGNGTRFSHTWQSSSVVRGGLPGGHPFTNDNARSFGTLNLLSGDSALSSDANSRLHRKNIHGVLNAVSWGILMPIGGIIARYMRVFPSADPAWFYLHVACQSSAYSLGVAGWGLGLKLGSDSPGLPHRNKIHRVIGIILFCFATLQVFALLLRPHKEHKYRLYWNVYHHSIGYGVIVLGIVNIWEGFALLSPEKKWENAYLGVIIALGGVALLLEAFTWVVVLRRRPQKDSGNGHVRSGTA